ncbi:MAG TPA: hypothetical protein VFR18_02390, partial [Terriglobia bacterium]|nr:hypothetical protein [Terriglobia bacterium]
METQDSSTAGTNAVERRSTPPESGGQRGRFAAAKKGVPKQTLWVCGVGTPARTGFARAAPLTQGGVGHRPQTCSTPDMKRRN